MNQLEIIEDNPLNCILYVEDMRGCCKLTILNAPTDLKTFVSETH